MADHRQQTTLQRLLASFSPRRLSRPLRIAILLEFLIFGPGLAALIYAVGWRVTAVAVLGFGLGGALTELWLSVRAARERDRLRTYHDGLQEWAESLEHLQAVTPDGAPTRAYWPAHCGCVHVTVWNGQNWAPEQVMSSPACPLVENYAGDQGGV